MLLAGCGGSGQPSSASSQPSSSRPPAQPSPAVSARSSGSPPAAARSRVTLVQFGAGTLAVPFKQINSAFAAAHPGLTIQAQFGGSVKMAKQITQLGQRADILAVADYNVIPQQLFAKDGKPGFTDWYAGFASNAITFVYTSKSKGADRITQDNWYKVLAEPGVQIGRSNPDTDPSGYQTLQMLKLAGTYYHAPGLSDAVLKNAPRTNMRDTETELLSALEAGQIDYLAIYRSDAKQHKLKFLNLPPQIDLSDAAYAKDYAKAVVTTKNGKLTAGPIVYAVTVPNTADHAALARRWIEFLVGDQGQQLMAQNGFVSVHPAYASDLSKVPADVKPLLRAWAS
ncbi:MAG: extracellular solute-binding protein [Chloroflexota bacterium]|nr:extracellular solute-binding protein [Chloroflexota bacterium]